MKQSEVIITDIDNTLTRAIKIRKTTLYHVAYKFLNNWIIPYGITDIVLAGNGQQSFWKIFISICNFLGDKKITETAYTQQTNGRVEHY